MLNGLFQIKFQTKFPNFIDHFICRNLLGRAQPVIPAAKSLLMNIIAWGPQVSRNEFEIQMNDRLSGPHNNLEYEI